MRKHRLLGVVIAVLIGVGALTHRSDTPHRTSGTASAGMQLASADIPTDSALAAGHAGSPRPAVAIDAADRSHEAGSSTDLLELVAGQRSLDPVVPVRAPRPWSGMCAWPS